MFGWVGDVLGWIGEQFSALAAPVDATAEQLEGFRSTGETVGKGIGTALGASPATAPPRDVSLVFHQTFTFAGAAPDVADEVAREMERVMRRASVEAGLVEADGAF